MTFSSLRSWGAGRRSPGRQSNRSRLSLLNLEERTVPAIAYAAGADAGTLAAADSQVIVYDENSTVVAKFDAFPGFLGGVRVAVGDVNNDGTNDVIVGAGPGGAPIVRVFDGAGLVGGIDRSLIDFYAFAPDFTGGVYVASGLITHPVGVNAPDPFADIVVGPGSGAPPIVNVFGGSNMNFDQVCVFFAFPVNPANGVQFSGGVRVAVADVGGDNGDVPGGQGHEEIICGAGPGGASHVTVWEYDNEFYAPDRFVSFFAYEEGFTGGVYVGGGNFTDNKDVDGFVYDDIVTGPGEGGGPLLRIWSTDDASDRDNYIMINTRSAVVYDPNLRVGLRVSGNRNVITTGLGPNSDNLWTIITSLGPGAKAIDGQLLFTTNTPEPPPIAELAAVGLYGVFPTFDPSFLGGMYVGA